jgi:hypothetical protein
MATPIPHGPKERLSRAEQAVRYEYQRRRYLPEAMDNARRKVAALENEARRYGMHELLEPGGQA